MYANLRVQYLMSWGDTPGVDTQYHGCASAAAPTGICTEANIDDCWCEILQGPIDAVDPVTDHHARDGRVLPQPAVDLHLSRLGPPPRQRPDLELSARAAVWSAVRGRGGSNERTDIIPFKKLYEGALFDFSAGRHVTPAPDLGKIDVKTEAPASVSGYNHSADSNPYCNGWNLLEDLPAPTGTTNIEDIKAFLEPMTTGRQVREQRRHLQLGRRLRQRPGQRRLQPGADGRRRFDPHQQFAPRGLRLVRGPAHRPVRGRPIPTTAAASGT